MPKEGKNMHARDRHTMLTTGRSGDFRNLAREMTNDPRDFPTKSQLRAQLAEVYPGDEYAEAREAIFGKLVKIAEARAGGMDLMELRGIVDEYVIKVETELASDDSLLPMSEETDAVDVSETIDYLDAFDPTEKSRRAIIAAHKAAELEGNRARMIRGDS